LGKRFTAKGISHI